MAKVVKAGVAAAMGLALLAGCDIKLSADPKVEAVAKSAYQHLVDKDDAGLEAMLIPSSRSPHDPETFAMIRNLIPEGAYQSVTLTGINVFAGTEGRTETLTYLYKYPTRNVAATSVMVPSGNGEWKLKSFNVNAEAAK